MLRKDQHLVILITGATSPIGEATARELAQRGYRLVLADRFGDHLAALTGALTQIGCSALPIATDMRRPEEAQRLAQVALAHFGRVDAVVNSFGVELSGAFVTQPMDAIETMIVANLQTPIELTNVLLPSMIARRRGAIIFVASIVPHIGAPSPALYNTIKFGLHGFALKLRREVKQHGIGITIVSPGFIDSPMSGPLQYIPKTTPELVARSIADAITRPRREIFVPAYCQLFAWVDRVFPGLIDLMLQWNTKKS